MECLSRLRRDFPFQFVKKRNSTWSRVQCARSLPLIDIAVVVVGDGRFRSDIWDRAVIGYILLTLSGFDRLHCKMWGEIRIPVWVKSHSRRAVVLRSNFKRTHHSTSWVIVYPLRKRWMQLHCVLCWMNFLISIPLFDQPHALNSTKKKNIDHMTHSAFAWIADESVSFQFSFERNDFYESVATVKNSMVDHQSNSAWILRRSLVARVIFHLIQCECEWKTELE